MRKASEDSQELKNLREQVAKILAEQNTDKIKAFRGIMDTLQDEAIAITAERATTCQSQYVDININGEKKSILNGRTPTETIVERENDLLERLNFVAKTAFENKLGAALPCADSHKGLKDEFYYRIDNVLFNDRKISPEKSNADLALERGEQQEKADQAHEKNLKRRTELAFKGNGR